MFQIVQYWHIRYLHFSGVARIFFRGGGADQFFTQQWFSNIQ